MHNNPNSIVRKIAATLVLAVLVLSGSALAPREAKAQWAVADFANTIQNTLSAIFDEQITVKEFVLDPLARMAAQRAIESVAKTTINWMNSGFDGSPAFVTNLRRDLQLLADQVADDFLGELGAEGAITSPFRDRLIDSIRDSYRRRTAQNSFFINNRFTLDETAIDAEAFLTQGFGQDRGGLRAWVAAWGDSQNNFFGAFRTTESELGRRVGSAEDSRRTQLDWSRGLFSPCSEPEEPATGGAAEGEGETELTQSPPGGSADCETTTLGSIAIDRLTEVTGADIESLISADELDEVLVGLLTQLMNQMFEDGGLAGTSRPGNSGTSPLDDATGGNAGQGTSVASNTINIINGQINRLEEFVSDWQTIRSAALAAKEMCDRRSADAARDAKIADAIARADAGIAKGQAAITRLNEIKAKLSTTGPNATEQIRIGFQEYEQFVASNSLPTGQEIAEAANESRDFDTDGASPSLVMEMNQLQRQCSPFGI
ncbi:MAG TPA: hypothetical protein VEB18_01085 [Candidatus Paceibacterota bacterium]|nr:hypothetical protein [Candidatus Paceibacterota bacterium]